MNTYLFKSGNNYKIGRSVDVFARFTSIKNVNLELECISFTNSDIEKELHDMFSHKRVEFEWFDLSNRDVVVILNLFDNKPIYETEYYDFIIDKQPYTGRRLVSLTSRKEMYWMKSQKEKEYKYWYAECMKYKPKDIHDHLLRQKQHYIQKVNSMIHEGINKGLISPSDLVEIFKHNEPYTCLKKVSMGIHSPQHYYQNKKTITLFGCKLISED